MARKNNFPAGALEQMPKQDAREITSSIIQLRGGGKPKDIGELRERIDGFFAFCESSSIRPGVETLCLALGVTRQTLNNWEHGMYCTEEWQELIVLAKAAIAAYLEQAVLSNKIFPGSGIFLLKNWCHYADTVTLETQGSSSMLPGETPAQIIKRRSEDIDPPERPNFE